MTPAEVAAGRLVVCPTPIGNLQDVTQRVLAALAQADAIACEDTRHTRVLLARHSLTTPLVSLHEHNERARARELVAAHARGARSSRWCPTPARRWCPIPASRSCASAWRRGIEVEVLPGPSAVTTALVASGLPAERWLFVGFLPRKRAELERLLAHTGQTLVAFESPRRLAGTLRALAEPDPERPAAVCRELTKLHEEVRRGSANELADHFEATAARGEIVLVVGAAPAGAGSRGTALQALRDSSPPARGPRPAAAAVARLTGVGANELYRELTSEAATETAGGPRGGGQ